MKKILLLLVLAAVGIGGYLYYRSLKIGPQYALAQAVLASQTHDVASFERYVDVRSIAGNLVDQVANQSSELGLPNLNGLVTKNVLQMLKPQLTAAARRQVQRLVETGSLQDAAIAEQTTQPLNLSVMGVVGKVVSPGSRFKSVQYVREQGEQALVGIEFTQPKYDTTLVVELRMQNQDDHWQVKEITNTKTLLQQIVRLEKNRVASGK